MKITLEEIKRLEKLSAFESSEEQLINLMKDFNEIAKFVEQINQSEITEELKHNRFLEMDELRPDKIKESMPQEEILSNAPEKENGAFIVPKVVE